jgi:hypothetical protein
MFELFADVFRVLCGSSSELIVYSEFVRSGSPSNELYSGVRLTDRIGVGVLTRLVNRDLVDDVLAETGRAEKRSRLLPARVVVYYVMALCLFFGEAYEEVMRRLVGGLQYLGAWRQVWTVPTTGAISQARARLGESPMRALFERVAEPMARPGTPGCWYRMWRVMAIDGVVLDVADTPVNAKEFGRSGNHLADSPFPQVRVVGLAECGTHAIVAAEIGTTKQYERELATDLLGDLTADMLVLADRGFYSYDMWQAARRTGAELLWRVKTHIDLPPYEVLPDGSYRSALLPKSMRSDVARGKGRRIERYEIPVRVIDYQIANRDTGGDIIRLVTSITDHELAPAAELAALYHERWEIELLLDEIETHQIASSRVLRSKTPELVRQEIWALLLTHYAVRHLMLEAADDTGSDPDRLSFIRSLRVIRRQVTDQAAFSPQPAEPRAPSHNQRNQRKTQPAPQAPHLPSTR